MRQVSAAVLVRVRSNRASSARVGVAIPDASASRVSHVAYASLESRRTMLRMAALASSVVASIPIVCPRTSWASASRCRDPREHGLVGLQVNQAAGARQRRMVRRGLMEIDIQEGADTQRIGRAPCDRALRVQAFTIPEQQQPARPARRQTRPTHRGSIEPRALLLHERVKTRIVEHTIQPLVEWMPSALWRPTWSLVGRAFASCPSPWIAL